MGNNQYDTVNYKKKSNARKLQTELILSDSNNQEIYEELDQKQPVNLCCIKGKIVKKKATWESRFITNCEKIKTDFGYTWIDGLVEVVRNNELPKIKFVKQVQNLRKQKSQVKIAQSTKLLQPEEVQKFKKNLKKSVIISFSQNNQNTKSTVQFGKSSLSSLSASIMMRKSRFNMNQDKKNACMSGFNHEKKLHISKRISGISRSNSGYSEDFGVNKQVPKYAATELEIFLEFSSILQRHLGQINCILGCLRKQFVYYFQQKFKDSVSASRQLDLVIETVQVFIVIITAGVIDYYNLKIFAKDQIGSNIFISNEENISSSCTSILFRDHQFYNSLFNCISYSLKEREERFKKILSFLAGSEPQRFQVKDKFCLNAKTINSYLNHLSCQSQQSSIVQNIQIKDIAMQYSEPYKACMIHLNEMTKSRSPVNKLKSLMACSEGITVQIQKFYDMNSLRKQKWMLDADQMLSIFCYLLVGAKVQHLHTHLFLLDNFASSLQMISMTGYYLSVMHCAVQQLQNQYGKEIDEINGLQ